jgi:SH3 domain-containing YSC84-like protein 1
MARNLLVRAALVLPAALLAAAMIAPASAQNAASSGMHKPSSSAMAHTNAMRTNSNGDDASDARAQVKKAVKVVSQMKSDAHMRNLLEKSKGVFIVPDYAKAAAIVGGRGGAGVLLLHENGKWSNPAFYNTGGISVGAQAGVAAGSIALVLMTPSAVDTFKNNPNNFSLNANAGLTLVNYSADAQGTAGKGDVVFWSDTEGLFAGASLGVSDINSDEGENRAYYGMPNVTPTQILTGAVTNPHAKPLQDALATRVAAK